MGTARAFNAGTALAASTIAAMDSGDWTAASWVYPTGSGAGNQGCIFQTAAAGIVRQTIRFATASLDLFIRQTGSTNGNATASTLLTINKWWCIVGTFRASDNKTRLFYGDEQTPMVEMAYASTSTLVTRSTGGTGLTMGNISGGGQGWGGALCNEILDAREWTLTEMEYFRRTGRPLSFGTLRCWFPLEGTGKTTAERDHAGLAADATITNNQGSQTGPTLWLPAKARLTQFARR